VSLTFHSGEDRRVKKVFESGLAAGLYSDIASEVIRPSPGSLSGLLKSGL
jgi:16S rRNA (cytosine1402-N4)-methyltransferase